MVDVVRLDFTQPPPGYRIGPGVDDAGAGCLWWMRGLQGDQGHRGDIAADAAKATACAWAHYKAETDPPGMYELWYGVFAANIAPPYLEGASALEREVAIRAAGWVWHDRRHALVKALEDEGMQIPLWPALLTRTDADCAACESWLKRGPAWAADDFPTVLKALARPCGPHCDCEANGHD